MKKRPFMRYGMATAVLFSTLFLLGCDDQQGPPDDKIRFDQKNAAVHVIPADSVRFYINSFTESSKELTAQVRDTGFLTNRFKMPVAELFNRDAIIALLNAPGATGVRIYLGRKPNGEVVFVLLPANKEGNDIYVKLVNRSDSSAQKRSATAASSEASLDGDEGQGIETGQRCPTMCDEGGRR